MSDEATCPTCGQRVEMHSAHEGTSYYVGLDARERESGAVWEKAVRDIERAVDEHGYWPQGALGHVRRIIDDARARAAS